MLGLGLAVAVVAWGIYIPGDALTMAVVVAMASGLPLVLLIVAVAAGAYIPTEVGWACIPTLVYTYAQPTSERRRQGPLPR